MIWAALTALALFCIGWIAFYVITLTGHALSYLQPLLIPVAVAAILAYLLDPVVEKIVAAGVTRTKAVLYVFAIVFIPLAGILLWVVPQLYHQSIEFGKQVPELVEGGRKNTLALTQKYQAQYAGNPYVQQVIDEAGNWIQQQAPALPGKIWTFVVGSVEGFLGGIGFLLGLIVVPVYLFFFLRDSATISRRWSDYLPLRSSAFKDEVVSCLTEINRYLIAFFRGQILVTSIDGALLAVALFIAGLKFALLIGLMVAVLQLIPYLGILLCWIPAALIALAQPGGGWKLLLVVTIIFIIVSNLDGFFIAPRIVGESVGLHPMTIIVSVLGWSLLIGGLLGALLAVPLTATLKVLLKRYVWERSLIRRKIAVPTSSGESVMVDMPE